jgi:hypothetical protein
MKAKRTDENQKQIVNQLRKIPGVSVQHTHMIGDGVPDIAVGYKKRNYWFEIKDEKKIPSKKKLTPDEEKWHGEWTGHVAKVETIDEILQIINK